MKTNKKKRVPLVVIVIFIFIVAFAMFFLVRAYQERQHTSSSSDSTSSTISTSEPERVHQGKKLNYLIVGVDDEADLTDVLMVARCDFANNKIDVLRIPRDTFVGDDIPSYKINAVFRTSADKEKDRIKALEKEIEEDFSLDIDGYVMISLETFREIVDAIGGVDIYIPEEMGELEGFWLTTGQQHLDGMRSEFLVRYRQGFAGGDIERINTQKMFMEAFFKTVKSNGRVKTLAALSSKFNKIHTDLGLSEMLSLGTEVFDINMEDINFHVVPGEGANYRGYAIYNADTEATLELINTYFRDPDDQAVSLGLKTAAAQAYNPQEDSGSSEPNSSHNSESDSNSDDEPVVD